MLDDYIMYWLEKIVPVNDALLKRAVPKMGQWLLTAAGACDIITTNWLPHGAPLRRGRSCRDQDILKMVNTGRAQCQA